MRDSKKGTTINNKTALILSGILPGAGQIYKGEYLKGIDLIIICCLSLFCLFYPASILFPLGVVLVPTLWVWGMADAGVSLPIRSRRWRHSRVRIKKLRKKMIMVVGVIWISAVIVFSITASAIKYKFTSSKNRVVIANKESTSGLLTEEESNSTSDGVTSNPNISNNSSVITIVPTEDSHPPKMTSASSDMTSTSTVDQEPEQFPQIDVPELEENPTPYVITVGAFSQYGNAEKRRILLSQRKYQALIVPAISSDNQKVHVVVVSGFSSISDANAIVGKLKREINSCRDCFVATLDKPTVQITIRK